MSFSLESDEVRFAGSYQFVVQGDLGLAVVNWSGVQMTLYSQRNENTY